MENLLINTKNKTDLKLFTDLAKRMGLKYKIIAEEDKEDLAMGKLIEKGMKTKSVPKSNILKILRK